jgi:Protein of unknown function (DUF2865)
VWFGRATRATEGAKTTSVRMTSARTGLPTCALAIAAIALSVSPAPAGGLFDFFFGGSRPQPQAPEVPPTAYAEPSTPAPFASQTLRDPSSQPTTSGAPHVAYCVRLCDGRYFPIQPRAGANPAQLCSGMCPASKTKIFNGTEIDHATANDGRRYADLENAFVYRKHLVDNCTCNGKDAFGTAPIDLASDPTLRAGDIVATADGLAKVNTAAGAHKSASFTPIDKSTPVDNMAVREDASARGKLARVGGGVGRD